MRTFLAALILGVVPALAIAECGHDRTAMSCAEGMTFDEDTRGCVPVTG